MHAIKLSILSCLSRLPRKSAHWKLQDNIQLQHTYEVPARIFDPSFVSDNEVPMDNSFVRNLAVIKPLARDGGDLVRELQRDLHFFIAESRCILLNHDCVGTFITFITSALTWWESM